MAFRFQKRIKIAPGVRLNVSKSGLSTTVGARGASVNIGKRGVYANAGIPGTGLSMRERLDKPKKKTARVTQEAAPAGALDMRAIPRKEEFFEAAPFETPQQARGLSRSKFTTYMIVLFAALVALVMITAGGETTSAPVITTLGVLLAIGLMLFLIARRVRNIGGPGWLPWLAVAGTIGIAVVLPLGLFVVFVLLAVWPGQA